MLEVPYIQVTAVVCAVTCYVRMSGRDIHYIGKVISVRCEDETESTALGQRSLNLTFLRSKKETIPLLLLLQGLCVEVSPEHQPKPKDERSNPPTVLQKDVVDKI